MKRRRTPISTGWFAGVGVVLMAIASAIEARAARLVTDSAGRQIEVPDRIERVLIGSLSSHGIGVLMSTHAPDQAFACADRVLLIRDGRIAAEGEPEAVLTPERLRAVYGVEVCVSRIPGLDRPVCAPKLEAAAAATVHGSRNWLTGQA